jgi:WD40 repeat protein
MEIVDKKIIHESVRNITWSPTMDIFAMITKDKILNISRFNFQKIHTKTFENKIQQLHWKPDGKQLCVILEGSKVLLLDIEDLRVVNEIERKENDEIEFIHWWMEKEQEGEIPTYHVLCLCTWNTIHL